MTIEIQRQSNTRMAHNFGIANVHGANLTALTSTDDGKRALTCWMNQASSDHNGSVGVRVSAVFVVLVTAALATAFPVVATRLKKVRVPLYVYLFARYFGAGVIVATAFIQ